MQTALKYFSLRMGNITFAPAANDDLLLPLPPYRMIILDVSSTNGRNALLNNSSYSGK
jgi:hypothetical protein